MPRSKGVKTSSIKAWGQKYVYCTIICIKDKHACTMYTYENTEIDPPFPLAVSPFVESVVS